MNRAVLTYAETAFPAHRVQPVRTVESRHSGGRTVVASFHSLGGAAEAAAQLPTRAEWDEVEVIELVGPSVSITGTPDRQGPAGLSPRRVGAVALVGAVIGAALGAVVTFAAGSEAALVILVMVAAAVLGGIVGMAAGGVARYGGAHAEEQTPVPTLRSVAVLSVWAPDEAVAAVVAHALSTRDPIEVRVLDPGGHWHAPNAD